MWETLIKVTYEDSVLDDDDKLYYKYLVRNFESCLADNVGNTFENSFLGKYLKPRNKVTQKHGYRSVVFIYNIGL